MQDNINIIQDIPEIVKVKRVILDKEIKKILGEKYAKEAERNYKKAFAYSITYKSKGKNIKGFIVEPRKGNNLPCIIWNRGGSRDYASVKIGDLFCYDSNIIPFVLDNYIVIITQYPGNAGGEGLDKMGSENDLASILDLYKILKNYKRVDIKRIGMYGKSRGGMMTYMCLPKVKWIKAAVVVSSTADEVNAPNFRKDWKEAQKILYGGSLGEMKKRSAVCWADKFPKKTPLLIMHGTADNRTNPEDSIKLSQLLLKNKVPFRLIIYEGTDHYLSKVREESRREILNWFNRFVKNNEKIPNLKPNGE